MRLLQVLGWVILMLGSAFFVRAREQPMREADTTALLAYPLDGEGLRFSLESGEEEVRLVSWLAHAPDGDADSRQGWAWQMEATALDRDGAPRFQRTWWVSSRDARDSARLDVGVEELTDDRLSTVRLEEISGARTLVVRAVDVPEGARVLTVAWRRAARSLAHKLRLLRTDNGAFHHDVAATLRLPAWRDVPTTARQALTDVQWERLGALPETGGLVPTERLLTNFRHSPWRPDPAAPISVEGGQAVAWNVVGPAVFYAEWTNVGAMPAATNGVVLRVVRADGEVEERVLPGFARVGPVVLPDELSSVQLALPANEGGRRVRAWLERGDGWGDAPAIRRDDLLLLGPDLRRIELYRTRPGDGGLQFDVPADEDLHVSVRAVRAAADRVGFHATGTTNGLATLTALGADDIVLGEWTLPLSADVSPFERPAGPDDDRTTAYGEVSASWIVPPPGIRQIRVEADRPVDVGLRSRPRLPFVPLPSERYARPTELLARTRYLPRDEDQSAVIAPREYERLYAEERVIQVDAQTRLEPATDIEDQRVARAWHTVRLPGATTLLAESAPTTTGRSRLGPAAAALTVGTAGRLPVDYRVEPSAAGTMAEFVVDGVVTRRRLATATGTVVLPVSSGARVAVRTPGLFLADAPGGAPWRGVKVAPLLPGRELVLPVPGGEGAFSVQVYQAPGAVGTLGWSLDAAPFDAGLYTNPPRRQDEVQLVERTEEALGLSVAGRWTARERVVVWVPPTGARQVRIRLQDATSPGWVRVTSTWAGAPVQGGERHGAVETP